MLLMRAKFINEKFTEDSDPINDMGIGIKQKLKKSLLPNLLESTTLKDRTNLKKFFGVSWKELYYLGEKDDFKDIDDSDTFINEYIKKIKKFTSPKNKIFQTKYQDEYNSTFMGYETKFGKIVVLKSRTLSFNDIETFYIGDIGIAIELNLVKINWKDFGYYYSDND